ncbi:MAG TPA: class I SAM-dependent methyltransferase [Prolixibacteraceae bacterium]|nr:class I SAM-dependent methyltransferase [Prolixibacteraceae bacterium]
MENSFDRKAASWDDNPRRKILIEQVAQALEKKMVFHPADHLLEYGSGTGQLGFLLLDKVGSLTFCDTSKEMLKQVDRKREESSAQNINLLLADFSIEKPPFAVYDKIVSMLVLHHVENIPALLRNVHYALKSGGIFCWIDLDREDGSFHDHEPVPHRGFDRREIETYLSDVGFELLDYSREISREKEINGEIRQFPLFIQLARKNREHKP